MSSVIIKTNCSDSVTLPTYADVGAAGADLHAHIPSGGYITIKPGKSALIKTGLHVAIPDGYELQIRPRSGLALKNQITVLNTPGTIDSSYRGEIGVILINHGDKDFDIEHGMRIAQAVCTPVHRASFNRVSTDEFEKLTTDRMCGGFGSSGV